MEASRRKELDAKLREMFRESQQDDTVKPKAKPVMNAACTVIRRRKGTPDKRIA